VALAPLAVLPSVVAWRRCRHDAVLWIGLALNGLLLLGLASLIVSVLIGESSVG
jgi:hypothetical protein